MGNGSQRLKDSADFVAPSNEEDGVAHSIQKFIL
jgi:hydroxymethylpyrimidine pyrophosphatase-like HAD family hydrolase